MSLFTSPITFTVNTIARVFNFRFNRTEGKTVVGEYYEPAAPLAQGQSIITKQDMSSNTKDRSLVSYKCNMLIADGITYKPVIINFTSVFHKEHTAAQRDEALEMMSQICATESFRTGIANRLV